MNNVFNKGIGGDLMTRQTTMRISGEELDILLKARNELLHRGLNNLPKKVQERAQELNISEFNRGAITALAAVGLIYLLEANN